jgi:hypothetical protein
MRAFGQPSDSEPFTMATRLLTPIRRRSTVDLSLHFFGVALKLERGRLEDNG